MRIPALRSRAFAGFLIAAWTTLTPVDAAARKPKPNKPTVVTPVDANRIQDDDDLSRNGTRKGVLEFSLGAVTAAISTTMVIYGSVQFYRGQQL